jgi:environmental stress-induced protein Ves
MTRHWLRADTHRRMRWKNGKGETIEVAVHPPEATLDTFDWRISMAAVVEDGAFSCFADIDRTLAVLQGGPLRLTVGEQSPVELTAAGAPRSFPADAPCYAQLLGGPVTDLNVMSRRGRWRHRLVRLVRGEVLHLTAATSVCIAAPGAAGLLVDDAPCALGALDALVLAPEAVVCLVTGEAWLAQFEPVAT